MEEMEYSYRDNWIVPNEIPPDQFSSHPQGEIVRKAEEYSSSTWFINQQQPGGKFLNKEAMNYSFPVSMNEVSRSHPTQHTRKCSAPSLAHYMTNNERGVVHESSLLENNASYLFSNDNQLAASFPQQYRRDAVVNSEPTYCKPFSVHPPKPARTSSQMSNLWIPPPMNSAKLERGFGNGVIDTEMVWDQNANNGANQNQFSTRSLDEGKMRDSFLGDWTSACWNSSPLTEDTTSKTPFSLFSKHPANHDDKEVVKNEFGEKLSTHYAGYLDMPSTTLPSKATQGDLGNVGWDYLFTADNHHSANYGDISSGHAPSSSYSNFNPNEVQYKDHWESELFQKMTKEKCPQKTVHNDQAWKTSNEGSSHYHFENDCHGCWFTSSPPSAHHWLPSEQTPPRALSTSFLTTHPEETQHEDLDVSELVDEVIKDVNTNNMELNHQPFTASTDQLSHDRYGEAECYLETASNMQQYAETTSFPLNTSTDFSKYQSFTPVNEVYYKIEDSNFEEQVSRYDLEQIEDQIAFEDRQHTIEMEMEEFNRSPNSYNNIEEILVVDGNEPGNGRDDFDQYAKNIVEERYLVNDYQWNVKVERNEDKKTDDDKKLDKDEETNEDETEETDQVQCTDDKNGEINEDYNKVGEEIGHEDTDEEIDEDDEFANGSDDDDFSTEFEEDEELDDSEDFDTESERDNVFDFDTNTNSEFTVGEVDTDTDASSSHSGYCFSGQAIARSHGCNDIRVFAYSTSAGLRQAVSIEMMDNSIEQCSNVIATDADEALYTILEVDESQNRIQECITSSITSLDGLHHNEPSSSTSLDAHVEDLEYSQRYSEDISDVDIDEINSGDIHTQDVPKVGCYSYKMLLSLPFSLYLFIKFRCKEGRNGWEGLGKPNEDLQHLYDV